MPSTDTLSISTTTGRVPTIDLDWKRRRIQGQDAQVARGTGATYLVFAPPEDAAWLYAMNPLLPACPITADRLLRLAVSDTTAEAQATAQDWEDRVVDVLVSTLARRP